MTGLQYLAKLEDLQVTQLAEESLNATSEPAVDIIAGQLAMGMRADGTEITPSYSPLTIELKKKKSGLSAITDRVTLYDTGQYYAGLYQVAKAGKITWGSRDSKADKLQQKYAGRGGKGLLGFNREGRAEYKPILQKDFNKRVKNKLK